VDQFLTRQEMLLLSKTFRLTLEPTVTQINWLAGVPWEQRPARQGGEWPPFCVEIKRTWTFTLTSLTPSWRSLEWLCFHLIVLFLSCCLRYECQSFNVHVSDWIIGKEVDRPGLLACTVAKKPLVSALT